jgi:hypothetical protein
MLRRRGVPALLTGAPAYVRAGPSTTRSSARPRGPAARRSPRPGEQLAAGRLDRGERVVALALDLAADTPVDSQPLGQGRGQEQSRGGDRVLGVEGDVDRRRRGRERRGRFASKGCLRFGLDAWRRNPHPPRPGDPIHNLADLNRPPHSWIQAHPSRGAASSPVGSWLPRSGPPRTRPTRRRRCSSASTRLGSNRSGLAAARRLYCASACSVSSSAS